MVLSLKKFGLSKFPSLRDMGYGVWGACLAFLFFGCVEYDRDNPLDPGSPLHAGQAEPSAGSREPSSVSQEPIYCSSSVLDYVPSSSSVEPGSSSEGAPSSSSAEADNPSSSSNAPLSSSIASSSSSQKPSSSSQAPSSSSLAPSSSSLAPSTNVLEDSRDGKTYRTVVIGTQTWMAENLNHNATGSKCYSNQDSNCDKYGRLYNWATAMDLPSSCNSASCSSQIQSPNHRGICPSGWHLPSNAEWDKLYRHADGTSETESPYSSPTAGTKLKSQTGWNSYGGVPAGTDEHGFSALPGGYGHSNGSFGDVGYGCSWWSASEYNSRNAYLRYMGYDYEDASWGYNGKSTILYSVRCLQD